MAQIEIPKFLSHLKVDARGYPIPFFVQWYDGKPEFRYLDPAKMDLIIHKHLCHICGKKLHKDYHYFISGPVGYKNRVASDGAMHRECAEYSMQVCPHLFFQKAERRENDELGKTIGKVAANGPVITEKPPYMLLIKSSKYKPIQYQGQTFLRFTPVSAEIYDYIDGKLKKVEP